MLKKIVKEYILKNKYDLFIVLTMLLLGILVGIGVYVFSDATAKDVLLTEATNVFKISNSKEYLEINVITNGIKTNIILVIVLSIASVTLFGRYIIEMLALMKGAMLSIYSLILFNVFGVGYGILAVGLLVILVNVIYIPSYIYLSVMFMEIHFNIFKRGCSGLTVLDVLGYIAKNMAAFVLIFSSIIAEQIASLVVLKLFASIN